MKMFKKFLKAFGISVAAFTGIILFVCGFFWLHTWLCDCSLYLAFLVDAILTTSMITGFVYTCMDDDFDEN